VTGDRRRCAPGRPPAQVRIQKIIDSLEIFTFHELDMELKKGTETNTAKKTVYKLFEEVVAQ